MSTESDVIPVQSPRLGVQVRLGIPSLRAVVLGLVALLILFRWLHLILALQTATYGREMQIKTEELRRLERQNNLLMSLVSEAESPVSLSDRVRQMGFVPRVPVYLPVEPPPVDNETGEPDSTGMLQCFESREARCQPGLRFVAQRGDDVPATASADTLTSEAWEDGMSLEMNGVH